MKRVLITGSSGLFGKKLIQELHSQHDKDLIIMGMDIVQPQKMEETHHLFEKVNITDKSAVVNAFKKFKPDTVVHLAFVVNPMKNYKKMRLINVEGTRNVFQATQEVGAARLLAASSATVYGAWKDNPFPMEESQQLRPIKGYQYSGEKAELEEMAREFATKNKDTYVSWIRPCIVLGENVKNFISKRLEDNVNLIIRGAKPSWQFVHVDDVARAILAILGNNGTGPYNVAPPDYISHDELLRLGSKRYTFTTSFFVLYILAWILWFIYLADSPPGLLYFLRYSWVVTPKRLTEELGFKFKYSSSKTLEEFIAHRKLKK